MNEEEESDEAETKLCTHSCENRPASQGKTYEFFEHLYVFPDDGDHSVWGE
jgi:hypothetical protein